MELLPSEQLLRVHRFRFLKANGCGQSSTSLVVEETVSSLPPGTPRCTARPDHPELVPRSEFTARGESVEEALQNCLAAIRPRRFYELFHPKA